MNINKAKNNQDSFFYKIMAIVALAALATIIIIIGLSSSGKSNAPAGTPDTQPTVTSPADTNGMQNTPSGDDPGTPDTPNTPNTTDTPDSPNTPTDPADTTSSESGDDPSDTTGNNNEDSPSYADGVPTEAEMMEKYKGTILEKTEDAGQEYIDNIIFLGDSTTYGLKAYKMLKDGKETLQVWTPINGTLSLNRATIDRIYYPDTKEEITISETVKKAKPDMMIITLGVNGVATLSETQFKGAYVDLIDTIKKASPNTKIILQSIFPAAKRYDTTKGIDNDKINRANIWVADVAKECGVKYLYTACALLGEDGYYMNDSYQNGDGLHLNEIGFEKELNYIRTHAYN